MISWDSFIMIDGRALALPAGNHSPDVLDRLLHPHATQQTPKDRQKSWEEAVLALLKSINKTDIGRLVLAEVKRSSRKLVILPTDDMADDLTQFRTQQKFAEVCSVAGDSVIKFFPFAATSLPRGRSFASFHIQRATFFPADENLIHELVHAARVMQGIPCLKAMGDGWQTLEEFIAILVTNMYISEKGVSVPGRLRGASGEVFIPLVLTAEQFWEKYLPAITEFEMSMLDFTIKLSRVPCRFNPLSVEKEVVWSRKK